MSQLSLARHHSLTPPHAYHPLHAHSLGVLTEGRIRDKQISVIIDSLVKFISSKEEELRDIASLALKTVVGSLPAGSTPARLAFDSLTPKLLSAVGDVSVCSTRHLPLPQLLTLIPLPPMRAVFFVTRAHHRLPRRPRRPLLALPEVRR